jgi:NTE family protein
VTATGDPRDGRSLGLVLSGGGANGAFEAGVVAALEEADLHPRILSGTSAGALNVAGMSAGMDAATLAELWRSVRTRDVYRLRRDVWNALRPGGLLGRGNLAVRALDSIGWTHLTSTAPLRRTLVAALGGERVDVRSDVRVAVSAVEMASGELVRFVNELPPPHRRRRRFRRVDLDVDHLMASAAIPILFPPADVAGTVHWDGGLVANTPLAPAMAFEPDAVVIVTTATRERPAAAPRSLGAAVSLLIDNVLAYSLSADLERAKLVNELATLGPPRADRRRVDLLLVEPVGLDLGSALDFEPALAERRIALGLEAGRRALAGWR